MTASHLWTLLVVVGLAACSAEPSRSNAQPETPEPASPAVSAESPAASDLRLTVDGREIGARLADNPTARDLANLLPLQLSFRDLNGVEKIARLPRPLTTDGVPDGSDPTVADIGYYAPANDLVLYYGDVGYFDGIVNVGRFDAGALEWIRGQPDGVAVAIDRA